MPETKIILGATYRDRLTGFEGIAIGRYEYLTGCTRVCIQSPQLVDGKTVEITLDAPQLTYVGITDEMARLRAEQHAVATSQAGAPG